MRFLDMFSGIGGFHKGITEAHPDWECVGHSDIDKYANIIYKKHFPDVMSYGDATKINPEELPEFDMLCGGFPCQSFSIAGKRGGLEDTRGTLFFEIARIAKHRKPKYLFLENVKGLLSHDNGRTLGTILNTMGELGYWWEYQVLNSKDFGVPQNRERVFIIGHLAGERSRPVFPLGESGKGVNGAQGERQRVWGNDTSNSQVANTLAQRDYKGGNNLIQQINNPSHSGDRVYSPNGIAPSVRARARSDKYASACIIQNEVQSIVRVRKHEVNIRGLQSLLRGNKNISNKGIAERLGVPLTMVEHWFRTDDCFSIPDARIWSKLKELLGISTDEFDKQIMEFEEREGVFEKSNRAYGTEGLSPTLTGTTAGEKICIPVLTPNRPTKRQNGRRFKENGEPSFTLTGQDIHGVMEGARIRRLTEVECERLQGFPDGFTEGISATQRYKCLGNAVSVPVIRAIAERM